MGDWTRDEVLVWFSADEWDEITSALRNRAPISPSSSVNPERDAPGKAAPKPAQTLAAGGPALLLENPGTVGVGEDPAVPAPMHAEQVRELRRLILILRELYTPEGVVVWLKDRVRKLERDL